MRKDIKIPEVNDVHMAAVCEFSEEHRSWDWSAFLINAKSKPIEMALIVSHGYEGEKTTSKLRHKVPLLPAKSYAKIEFLEETLLTLNNRFSVTFFMDGTMYAQDFLFPKGTISEKKMVKLPVMKEKGVLAI